MSKKRKLNIEEINPMNYIIGAMPMILDKNFSSEEKLEFILSAMDSYASDVYKSAYAKGIRHNDIKNK